MYNHTYLILTCLSDLNKSKKVTFYTSLSGYFGLTPTGFGLLAGHCKILLPAAPSFLDSDSVLTDGQAPVHAFKTCSFTIFNNSCWILNPNNNLDRILIPNYFKRNFLFNRFVALWKNETLWRAPYSTICDSVFSFGDLAQLDIIFVHAQSVDFWIKWNFFEEGAYF